MTGKSLRDLPTNHETTVQSFAYCCLAKCSCGWFKWAKFGHKAAEKLARKHVESREGRGDD